MTTLTIKDLSAQQKGVCAMRLKTIFALTAVLALPTALSAAGLDNFYGVAMAACVPTGQTSAPVGPVQFGRRGVFSRRGLRRDYPDLRHPEHAQPDLQDDGQVQR